MPCWIYPPSINFSHIRNWDHHGRVSVSSKFYPSPAPRMLIFGQHMPELSLICLFSITESELVLRSNILMDQPPHAQCGKLWKIYLWIIFMWSTLEKMTIHWTKTSPSPPCPPCFLNWKTFRELSFYSCPITKKNPTLSMKVLKGSKQVEREKTETIWDRFDRLQRSLAPLRKGRQIKKGVHRIRRTDTERS